MQASFFISYVVTSGWTGLSSEILRLVPLLWSFITKLFGKEDDKEFEVPSTPFCQEIPKILFFGLLGTTYFFLSPLILPFLLVYYCLGYVIYRNQVSELILPFSFFINRVSNNLIWKMIAIAFSWTMLSIFSTDVPQNSDKAI